MDIQIQLINGRQVTCTINDHQAGAEFLRNVNYWELFERDALRIHGPRDTWMINPKFIEKIRFLTDEDPGWRPPENILEARCISRDAYQTRLEALDAGQQPESAQFEEGKLAEAVIRITLASGAVEYFQYLVMLRSPLEQRMNLSLLFQKVATMASCEDGGFVLINPQSIVCIHLHPAPPESAEAAWLVEELAESPAF